jgi:hypothetical protein
VTEEADADANSPSDADTDSEDPAATVTADDSSPLEGKSRQQYDLL